VRVGVDIGGTFTDVVAFDEDRHTVALAKVLTTPAALAQGVQEGLEKAVVPLGAASFLIHGSTIVVNAILERRGAKTALVTTQGFRDVYEIGRINRPESFNLRFRKHRPLVPRELVFEVPERMLADGTELTPLDEAAAGAVSQLLQDAGIEAVAVVFLHAYRAPAHEVRMCEILHETNASFFVTASHELSREYREYERTSTSVANTSVGPIVSTYLGDLEQRLAQQGFRGSLMIMQSNGGLQDVVTARRQCIQMMESGPAGGVVGTLAVCEALGLEAAIAFDMGGTTAKACVIRRGEPGLSPDYFFGGYNEGLAIRIPVLDIVEVGTGGGSIAWIDDGEALHVGPRSAGAEPGPVCYGRGGTEPTLTDANVVLGRLAPEQFLGGAIRLDRTAAAALSERIATPLGVDLERAASGMLEIATVSMATPPPGFPKPAVPRPSPRETPASSASRLLSRLSRPRLAAPRLAARRFRRPPRASSGRRQRRGKMPVVFPIRAGGGRRGSDGAKRPVVFPIRSGARLIRGHDPTDGCGTLRARSQLCRYDALPALGRGSGGQV
jgi:N-methylhydantoinase A